MKKFVTLAAAVLAAGMAVKASAATAVALELALVVDVSGSVDDTEFALQRTGYVNAFNNAGIKTAITNSPGGVAVALFYFDQGSYVGVNWTLLQSATDSANFATAIGGAARPANGSTGVAQAITFAANQINTNTYLGVKKVIDVSGDGAENVGGNTALARNNALAGGVNAINGLPILGEAGLLAFYQNNVQGGTGSFTLAADSFADFSDAVALKIVSEITGTSPVPLPAAAWMGLISLGGAAVYARKRRA